MTGSGGHGDPTHLHRPPGGSNIAVADDAARARHCWLLLGDRPSAALLLEWRRTPTGWEGYVARPVPGGMACAWLSSELITPVDRPLR